MPLDVRLKMERRVPVNWALELCGANEISMTELSLEVARKDYPSPKAENMEASATMNTSLVQIFSHVRFRFMFAYESQGLVRNKAVGLRCLVFMFRSCWVSAIYQLPLSAHICKYSCITCFCLALCTDRILSRSPLSRRYCSSTQSYYAMCSLLLALILFQPFDVLFIRSLESMFVHLRCRH